MLKREKLYCQVAEVQLPSPLAQFVAAHCILYTSFCAGSVAMMACHFLLGFAFVLGSMAQGPDEGYSRDQLQPLTKFRSNDYSIRCTFESACSTYLMYRQQHRRTLEGLLELLVFAFGDQCWDSNQHFAHDHCMSTSYSGSIACGCWYVSDMFEMSIVLYVASIGGTK